MNDIKPIYLFTFNPYAFFNYTTVQLVFGGVQDIYTNLMALNLDMISNCSHIISI